MSVQTVTVHNITFHVYYDIETERDPYGTGDSPTAHYLTINEIEIGDDTQDVYEILPQSIIELIENEILTNTAGE